MQGHWLIGLTSTNKQKTLKCHRNGLNPWSMSSRKNRSGCERTEKQNMSSSPRRPRINRKL